MKNNTKSTINGISSTASTQCTNDQQWTKYHSKQGHGFAAEDANAMWERWHGKKVEKVGLDNSLNGADRISNGVQIQTKYYADAGKSVGAAFENGTYRYNSMKLEVPSDQYEEAVRTQPHHPTRAKPSRCQALLFTLKPLPLSKEVL